MEKKIKLFVSLCFIVLWSCGDNDDPVSLDEQEPKIELNKTTLTMFVEDKDTLSLTSNVGFDKIDWVSSEPAVVAVNEQGIVEALVPGTSTVTAIVDDLEATCSIQVDLKPLELNKSNLTLEVTDRDTLLVVSELFGYTPDWKSSDPTIVSVDSDGRLIALNSGTAEISATVSGQTATCKVTVDLTIFLGGTYKEFEAAYWKGGQLYPLTTDGNDLGLYSHVTSIKVVNGNIFAGGQKVERKTTYWKNGVETILIAGGANAVRGLSVLRNEIIGVGGYNRVFLWNEQDGISYWTSSEDKASGAAIYVDGSDVYVAGTVTVGDVYRATVWKNQQAFTLDYDLSHAVHDLTVSDGDFYVCASEYIDRGLYKSKYWKNEKVMELTDGSSFAIPKAIHVIGEDVFVGGYINGRPVLWKNDETIFYAADGIEGSIRELTSVGNDLYAVGNIYLGENSPVGVVWKNGEEIFRTELFDDAYLESIDIK